MDSVKTNKQKKQTPAGKPTDKRHTETEFSKILCLSSSDIAHPWSCLSYAHMKLKGMHPIDTFLETCQCK